MHTLLQPLIDVLFAAMSFLHDSLGLRWGWSIVLLTVIVRIILVPATFKQFKSMRSLQMLQPQIKEIQEKYKDDRSTMQQKVMEYYGENKVNPFGSLLPLLVQMPVFFALFYMLQAQSKVGGVFAGEPWLWIGAAPHAPAWLLVAGDITAFDLPLLLLYVASQFLSSMMMGTGDQMQRMIKYVMPVGIGVIMFIGRWPAGLFIYWFTSNMWTIGQQYLINRTTKIPTPPAVAEISSEGKSDTTEGHRAAEAEAEAKRRTTKRTDRAGRGPASAGRAGCRSY